MIIKTAWEIWVDIPEKDIDNLSYERYIKVRDILLIFKDFNTLSQPVVHLRVALMLKELKYKNMN